jgi:hypothetical protein
MILVIISIFITEVYSIVETTVESNKGEKKEEKVSSSVTLVTTKKGLNLVNIQKEEEGSLKKCE